MTLAIRYSRQAEKKLQKIPIQWRKRIVDAIDGLIAHPYQGKKLKGEYKGLLVMRVWPYRIIYTVEWDIRIFIVNIAHRQNIYK